MDFFLLPKLSVHRSSLRHGRLCVHRYKHHRGDQLKVSVFPSNLHRGRRCVRKFGYR